MLKLFQQPLCINKLFKTYVQIDVDEHMDADMDLYIERKLTAQQRRVLTTNWVANAWRKIKENKELIIPQLLKCGLLTEVKMH